MTVEHKSRSPFFFLLVFVMCVFAVKFMCLEFDLCPQKERRKKRAALVELALLSFLFISITAEVLQLFQCPSAASVYFAPDKYACCYSEVDGNAHSLE